MWHRNCIIVFVKAPVYGTVKTRLAEKTGPAAALALYRAFVADSLERLFTVNADLRLYFDPPESRQSITEWLGTDLPLSAQTGNDLGQRMAAALAESLAMGYDNAVLVGSDLPDLPASIVSEALEGLARFSAVLGPGTDGGYYLIGFRRDGFCGDVFSNIEWSTDQVFTRTMERFDQLQQPVYVLPPWQDIDTYADLKNLILRVKNSPDSVPHTENALLEWGLME
ncbi:MAG: TIGR04282 family arsenosugar biosynthesis glycosyltransferase [Thermodesulfobacteriota bacterium]